VTIIEIATQNTFKADLRQLGSPQLDDSCDTRLKDLDETSNFPSFDSQRCCTMLAIKDYKQTNKQTNKTNIHSYTQTHTHKHTHTHIHHAIVRTMMMFACFDENDDEKDDAKNEIF